METVEPYALPAHLYDAWQVLRPPEDLTVSQWAAKYRRLDSRSSAMPGPWLNEKVPYLVGVMDAFNQYEVEKIVMCCNAQAAKTESGLNILGWIIQQDPAPTLIVYPTDKMAEWTSENRIQPMIQATPTLRRLFDPLRSQKSELQFQGMYIALVGSNSPANLASRPIKNLILDEVDKFPGATGKEADPVSLAMDRQITFSDSKTLLLSTPTFTEGRIWRELQMCDCEKHFFVPCPHCGEFIELTFSNLTWPDKESGLSPAERAEQAVYVCQECGCAISEYHKDTMLRGGEWRVVRENNPVHKSVGFWINALYSPFVRFSKLAFDFMAAKDDPELLQNFVNSMLGEPWEDRTNGTSADLVMERQTDVPEFTVPDWARLITAGVDVQQDCMYYTVRAWGAGLTSQNLTHGKVQTWTDIVRVMDSLYTRQDGRHMRVGMCYVDSGFSSDEVYDFCAQNPDWAVPVKGSSNPMTTPTRSSYLNPSSRRHYGMEIVVIDTGLFKDWIAGRMKLPNGTGSWMVHEGCDKEYAQQVTSEHKVRHRQANGRTKEEWVPKRSHAANHLLDCEVYAFAAAHDSRIRTELVAEEDDER